MPPGFPPTAEIARYLWGAWRLVKRDTQGLEVFGHTVDDFWRSFWAAALVAPFYLAVSLLRYVVDPNAGPFITTIAAETAAYANLWLAFPFAMLFIARGLDREKQYIRYIVAYNWASVLQSVFYTTVVLVGMSGLLPPDVANLLGFAALIAIIAYTWFITRVALDIPGLTAGGLVAIDLTLGLVIQSISDGLSR